MPGELGQYGIRMHSRIQRMGNHGHRCPGQQALRQQALNGRPIVREAEKRLFAREKQLLAERANWTKLGLNRSQFAL